MRFPAGIILSLALTIAALAGAAAQTSAPTTATATFAGGCFWCTEADFDKVEGVISTTSGYIGGMAVNPTYEQVVTGRTGHTEAVEVVYDPAVVSYEQLLDVFWRTTIRSRRIASSATAATSIGPASSITARSSARSPRRPRRRIRRASSSRSRPRSPPRRPSTRPRTITRTTTRRIRCAIKFYRFNCGRDARLEELWGKPGS